MEQRAADRGLVVCSALRCRLTGRDLASNAAARHLHPKSLDQRCTIYLGILCRGTRYYVHTMYGGGRGVRCWDLPQRTACLQSTRQQTVEPVSREIPSRIRLDIRRGSAYCAGVATCRRRIEEQAAATHLVDERRIPARLVLKRSHAHLIAGRIVQLGFVWPAFSPPSFILSSHPARLPLPWRWLGSLDQTRVASIRSA